jgi:hypothetical protein
VEAAQKIWGDAVVDIGAHCRPGVDDHRGCYAFAAHLVDTLYAYDLGNVLFKPTMAAANQRGEMHEFRMDREAAISYFVGDNPEYPEDTGFALKGWTKVRFHNAGTILREESATAMGNYFFTSPKDGKETKVEYSFGYRRDLHAQASRALRVNFHHSSIPFSTDKRTKIWDVLRGFVGVVLTWGIFIYVRNHWRRTGLSPVAQAWRVFAKLTGKNPKQLDGLLAAGSGGPSSLSMLGGIKGMADIDKSL